MTQKEIVKDFGNPDSHFLNNKFWIYKYSDSPWQGTVVFEFNDQGKLIYVHQELDDPQRQTIP